jgi:hypothetical protein
LAAGIRPTRIAGTVGFEMRRHADREPLAVDARRPRSGRPDGSTAEAGRLLGHQAAAGNRATGLVVARLRAEAADEGRDERVSDGTVGAPPAPEEEPVQRLAASVQRHHIPSKVVGPPPPAQEDAGSVRAEGGGDGPTQRQTAPAPHRCSRSTGRCGR